MAFRKHPCPIQSNLNHPKDLLFLSYWKGRWTTSKHQTTCLSLPGPTYPKATRHHQQPQQVPMGGVYTTNPQAFNQTPNAMGMMPQQQPPPAATMGMMQNQGMMMNPQQQQMQQAGFNSGMNAGMMQGQPQQQPMMHGQQPGFNNPQASFSGGGFQQSGPPIVAPNQANRQPGQQRPLILPYPCF